MNAFESLNVLKLLILTGTIQLILPLLDGLFESLLPVTEEIHIQSNRFKVNLFHLPFYISHLLNHYKGYINTTEI